MNVDANASSLAFQAEIAPIISAGLWITRFRRRIAWLLRCHWLRKQPRELLQSFADAKPTIWGPEMFSERAHSPIRAIGHYRPA